VWFHTTRAGAIRLFIQMGILSSISSLALKPSVLVGNLITSGIEKVTGEDYGRTTSKQLASTTAGKVLGSSIALTGGALAVASGTAAAVIRVVAPAVVKAVVTSPVKTVLGGAIATGIIASGAGTEIITSTYKAGKTTGEVLTGEIPLTSDTVKDVGKVVGVTLGLGAVGTAAGYVASEVLDKDEEIAPLGTPAAVSPVTAASEIAPSGLSEMPLTPQTVSTTTKKRSRKGKAKLSPSMKQSVIVNVGNRRYLNVNNY